MQEPVRALHEPSLDHLRILALEPSEVGTGAAEASSSSRSWTAPVPCLPADIRFARLTGLGARGDAVCATGGCAPGTSGRWWRVLGNFTTSHSDGGDQQPGLPVQWHSTHQCREDSKKRARAQSFLPSSSGSGLWAAPRRARLSRWWMSKSRLSVTLRLCISSAPMRSAGAKAASCTFSIDSLSGA